ncbi:MAG: hypothetical protein D6732_08390 [Methanobacteriota archaeon]|nr:MAG: hypothetical protein D6732_08390 [Euryarchaeota archaeon]
MLNKSGMYIIIFNPSDHEDGHNGCWMHDNNKLVAQSITNFKYSHAPTEAVQILCSKLSINGNHVWGEIFTDDLSYNVKQIDIMWAIEDIIDHLHQTTGNEELTAVVFRVDKSKENPIIPEIVGSWVSEGDQESRHVRTKWAFEKAIGMLRETIEAQERIRQETSAAPSA